MDWLLYYLLSDCETSNHNHFFYETVISYSSAQRITKIYRQLFGRCKNLKFHRKYIRISILKIIKNHIIACIQSIHRMYNQLLIKHFIMKTVEPIWVIKCVVSFHRITIIIQKNVLSIFHFYWTFRTLCTIQRK